MADPMMIPPQQPVVVVQPAINSTAKPCGDPMIDGMLYFSEMVVKQKMSGKKQLIEFMGLETNNKYKIYNPNGANPKEEVFVAKEDSSCCCRSFCGAQRSFVIHVCTADDKHVATLKRDFHMGREGCCCGCLPCCCCECGYQSVDVYTGSSCANPEKFLGKIREQYSCCHPNFSVLNADGEEVYHINAESVECCTFGKVKFDINGPGMDKNGESFGKIKKKWRGAVKELFTDADTFCITFPEAADGETRLLLLGAVFLIDFLFFEGNHSTLDN